MGHQRITGDQAAKERRRQALQQQQEEKEKRQGQDVSSQQAMKERRHQALQQQAEQERQAKEKERLQKESAALFQEQTAHELPQSMVANARANYLKEQADNAEQEHKAYTASKEYADDVKKSVTDSVKKAATSEVPRNASQAAQSATTAKEKELKAKVDYYRNQEQSYRDEATMLRDVETFEKWPEEDQRLLQRYVANRATGLLDGQAVGFLGALAIDELNEKYGKETVARMAESYSRYQNQKLTKKVSELGEKSASGFWGKVGSATLARGTNLIGNVTSAMDTANEFLADAAFGTGRYSGLDPNLAGNLPFTYAGAVDNKITSDLKEMGTLGKVGAYAYQGTMSAADSFARLAVAGETGSLALAAMGTFGQTVNQVSAQGGNKYQALAMGVIDGGLEVLTEKVSLDNLVGQSKAGYQSAKQIAKNIFTQAGVEVSEEELSFIGSTLAEAAVLQGKSSYQQQIGELIANGMSYEDAKNEACMALVKEAGQTAVISAFSGGLMSGANSVVNNIATGSQRNAQQTQNEQQIQPQEAQAGQEAEQSWKVSIVESIADSILRAKEKAQTESVEPTVEEKQARNRQALEETLNEMFGPETQTEGNSPEEVHSPTYEELSGKNDIPVINVGANNEGKSYAQLKAEALRKATQEKWFDEPHTNADTGMPIFLTNKTFTHAFSNLRSDFGTDTILAMNHLPELIQDAVLTDVANPKNSNKPEKRVYTFLAAINGEGGVEPVKLTVKEYDSRIENALPQNILNYFRRNKAAKTNNRLYDVKALEVVGIESAETEKEFGASAIVAGGQGPTANSTPNSSIRIADLLDLVKGDAEKYVPKRATSDGQNKNASKEVGSINRSDANPESSVGAAEQGFTGKESYYDLLTDENSQPDRAGDVRPMEIPKTDAYGRRVSEFAANAYGAEVTPDAMASRIEELVADGALGFDTRTNKESMEAAAAEIQKRGMDSVRTKITSALVKGKIKDGDIEKAMLLYATYANQKSRSAQETAAGLMVDLVTMSHMTGRNLQLFKIFRKMTPEGQLMAVQKNVERYVDQLNSKRGKKNQVDINIPQELMDEYLDAAKTDITEQSDESAKAKEEIEQTVYKVVASQIKATPMEKLNAWRYMAMLGNVKTQVRNIAGNAAFRPYVATKRAVGAVMEQMFVERENRTKSILGFGKGAKALRQWAAQDAKTADVEKLFSYSAQTGDTARGQIEDNRAIFNTKALEATRKFIQAVPEGADMIFKRAEYTVSLASFLKARGYTVADLQAGNVADGVLNEGRTYAAQEALKATFNDQNSVSDFLSKRYKGNNVFGKAMNILAEGVLPFRRTPANILVRAVEYSPANVVRSLYNCATKVRSGEMTAATAIDQMASGLTGAGAMVLGYAMASGVFGFELVGHLDDEDEENAGHQSYAVEIGGKSYTVNWAAPANIPLFVGANIYNAMKEKDPDTGWFVTAVEASVNSLEPMLELSCLSSLNDLLESVKYAEEGTEFYTIVAQAATSYLNQYIPTLFGQIEQGTEKTKKQVYSDADTVLERSIEKTIGRATQKIPGLDLYQVQKYDNWGRPVETSSLFDAMINPSYASEISTDLIDAEIQRLNDAQSENVSISKPAQTITYTDTNGETHKNERVSAEQWDTIQRVYGQTAASILSDIISSKDYTALADTQKAKVFEYVYDYAREKSRVEAIEGYPGMSESWMEGVDGKEKTTIIKKVATGTISGAFNSLTADWKDGRDGTDAAAELDEAYEVYQGLSSVTKREIQEDASGQMGDFLAAKEEGVDTGTFVQLYKTYYDINTQENVKATEKANQWAYELQKAKESGEITGQQMRVLKSEMSISSGFTVETEKFDAMTESGLSADKADYVTSLMEGIEPQTGYSDVRAIQKYEQIAKSNLSESEIDNVMKLYMPDYDPNDKQSDKTELKYDNVREKGYSAEEYAETYRAYLDADKKADKIAAIVALGYSQKEANLLYQIYYGTYFKDK